MNNPEIDQYGNKNWYNDKGQLHNENGPATITIRGNKGWYINGARHREDGPAFIGVAGEKRWYLYGKMIR